MNQITLSAETPDHALAIESLTDSGFGTARHSLTVYRLREGVPPIAELCMVAMINEKVVGTIRFWPVSIEGTPALLLGPITVHEDHRSDGIGAMLIDAGLDRARRLGHAIVLLVGDEPYYQRFGFKRALAVSLSLPGPVDDDRFLAQELIPGALEGVCGIVSKA